MSASTSTELSDFSNGLVELGEDATPRHGAVLDLVELTFHTRREPDVEDVGELLHHHALDALA